jgi:hypothetical protein
MDVPLPSFEFPDKPTASRQKRKSIAFGLDIEASAAANDPFSPPGAAEPIAPKQPEQKAAAQPQVRFEFASHYTKGYGEARTARDIVPSVCLSQILDPSILSPEAAYLYLNSLYPEAKRPKDPVEQMMFDQLTIAHHRLLKLQATADKVNDPAAVEIFNSAVARLMAEFRKFALALQQYRQPVSTRSFAVIQQQNVAHEQQVSYTQQTGPEAKETLKVCDTKLGSNGARITDYEHQSVDHA